MKFAQLLASLLEERSMSAAQLARDTGVAQSTVSNWLTGRTVPGIHSLLLIEDALGTTVATRVGALRGRCALPDCRRQFVKGRPFQRYCRRSCANRAADLRRAKDQRRRTGSDLRAVLSGIDRMCRQCVGSSSVCVQADCPLRNWSPYPLSRTARAVA